MILTTVGKLRIWVACKTVDVEPLFEVVLKIHSRKYSSLNFFIYSLIICSLITVQIQRGKWSVLYSSENFTAMSNHCTHCYDDLSTKLPKLNYHICNFSPIGSENRVCFWALIKPCETIITFYHILEFMFCVNFIWFSANMRQAM